MSYAETRDAAMQSTLAAIDDATETRCGLESCREPLDPCGPSEYWCDDWCQAKWMDSQADDTGDVYDRDDYWGQDPDDDDDEEMLRAFQQRWIESPRMPSFTEAVEEYQRPWRELMRRNAEQAAREWEIVIRVMQEATNTPAGDIETFRRVTVQSSRRNGREDGEE